MPPFHLEPFHPVGLDAARLDALIDHHETERLPRYDRYWRYFRNPAERVTERDGRVARVRWRCAQASSLPSRLLDSPPGVAAKEIVVENDIAWRIETLIDYTVGREVRFASRARAAETRDAIDALLAVLFDANGGVEWLQQAALLAAVYGHVDFLLRADHLFAFPANGGDHDHNYDPDTTPIETLDPPASAESPVRVPSNPFLDDAALRAASNLRLETVAAPRAIPLLHPHDFRRIDALILRYRARRTTTTPSAPADAAAPRADHEAARTPSHSRSNPLARFWSRAAATGPRPNDRFAASSSNPDAEFVQITEILSADHRQVYEDDTLILDRPNPLGVLPLAHTPNFTQPYRYEGVGEVEPLIPLQDELNIRLSDRANRITMQSFRMFLGKGISEFDERPVGPGQMWTTDNTDASVESFGGDAASPSEDAHVREVREALDKASAVTPLAAGLIRAKVGTLSSENALRISLLGLISKVERKRRVYARSLERLFAFALEALDRAGVFATDEADRRVEVTWSAPIPETESERLENALRKRDLGVPADRLLDELGYGAESADAAPPAPAALSIATP
ncbi:MAG: phage portal protein [Phycisphaerales bacterium]